MSEISDGTRMPRASVGWAIATLIRAGVIQKEGQENAPARYRLNKNFDTWMIQAADRLPLLSNPLDGKGAKPSNPLDKPSNPLDETVQPIGRSYKELKKERKGKKEGALARFTKPTFEEVQEYCRSRRNGVNPRKWYDHYEANGWRIGRNPMKDWRAAVRTWELESVAQPAPKAARCRCRRDGSEYKPKVLARDGETVICVPCRESEDIAAGVL